MDRFSKFHPIVGFSFFMLVIIITLLFMNPVFLSISFICSFLYLLKINGKSAFGTLFKFIIPLVLLVGIFNMAFCHYGETVLFSIKRLDFTLECLIFGLCTGLMLASVIMWFSAYGKVITSEKFMALFGKYAPNLTLLFSMVLRFIPLMKKTADEIKDAQTGLGKETAGIKNTINRFSALVSICLEKSIDTADSMKARGFGIGRRSAYSKYSFKMQDAVLLFTILMCSVYCIYVKAAGGFEFLYSTVIELKRTDFISPAVFFVFCFTPLLTDFTEDAKWLYLKSKI